MIQRKPASNVARFPASATSASASTAAATPPRLIVLDTIVGALPTVRLAFAWTRAEHVPLILGQVNFFAQFDVCFFRSRALFEVKPRP